MVHGYHVIMPSYGFWLPNDPRGTWSEFVFRWELSCFGKATRTDERRTLEQLTPDEIARRDAARAALRYPPVTLTGLQAKAVGDGFAKQVTKSGYTIWACSILPEHTHMVIARHTYKVEQIVNLMKGAATTRLIDSGIHPQAAFAKAGERPPRMWGEHEWKVYLDREEAIENAIAYVEDNPVGEGKPRQHWTFVTPFAGLPTGHVTYHS